MAGKFGCSWKCQGGGGGGGASQVKVGKQPERGRNTPIIAIIMLNVLKTRDNGDVTLTQKATYKAAAENKFLF